MTKLPMSALVIISRLGMLRMHYGIHYIAWWLTTPDFCNIKLLERNAALSQTHETRVRPKPLK